jgi:hypothetical protein
MRAHPLTALIFGLTLMLGINLSAPAGMSSPGLFSQAEPAGAIQEAAEQEGIQASSEPEKVLGSPKDIKEETAIYVFLGWLWLSILVLIYLLRLKIRECDRLDNFDYFLTPEKPEPEA